MQNTIVLHGFNVYINRAQKKKRISCENEKPFLRQFRLSFQLSLDFATRTVTTESRIMISVRTLVRKAGPVSAIAADVTVDIL